ncbi:GFA family protein [Enterobacter kobei]
MNGSCLCGTIEFELTHKPAVFYRCHCSLWTDPTPVDKFFPHDEACSKASGLRPPR